MRQGITSKPHKTLGEEHMELVHPDGSECPDGCDLPPYYAPAPEAQQFCYDERHETPCPLPCDACAEECDPPRPQARAPEAQHTPGPWEWYPEGTQERGIIGHHEPHSNLTRVVCETAYRDDESMANALLIARAPELLAENERLRATNAELLEALRAVAHIPCEQPAGGHCTMLYEHTGRMCPWCSARAAIAKATGEGK